MENRVVETLSIACKAIVIAVILIPQKKCPLQERVLPFEKWTDYLRDVWRPIYSNFKFCFVECTSVRESATKQPYGNHDLRCRLIRGCSDSNKSYIRYLSNPYQPLYNFLMWSWAVPTRRPNTLSKILI